MLKFLALLPLAIVIYGSALAQTSSTSKRGEFYFSWGYNRDWYSTSNIHVTYRNNENSKTADFMLFNATAHDKPDFYRWWQLDRLTIPQYDFTAGYFFNDKNDLGIELGWNHLKYVVTDWQNVHIKGQINGNYIDKYVHLNPDTFHLQHTNGNNYLLVSLIKRKNLFNSRYVNASAIVKAGAGPLISYTIDTVLGDSDPGYFHYHGYVLAASAGLRILFFKNLFIQSDMQGAYANYTDTKLGHDHLGRAYHHFYSLQWSYAMGATFPIGKKRKS